MNDDERDALDNVEIDVQPSGDDEDEEEDDEDALDNKEIDVQPSSSDEDEKGNRDKPENSGAGQSNEDKLKDNENQQRSSSDDKQGKCGDE